MPIDTSLASLTATPPSGPAATIQVDPAGPAAGDAFGGFLRDILRQTLPAAPTQLSAATPANPPVVGDAVGALGCPAAPETVPDDLPMQATLPSVPPLPPQEAALKPAAAAAGSTGVPTAAPPLSGRVNRSADDADESDDADDHSTDAGTSAELSYGAALASQAALTAQIAVPIPRPPDDPAIPVGLPPDAVPRPADVAVAATAQAGATPLPSRGRATSDRSADIAPHAASAHVRAVPDTAADPAAVPVPNPAGASQDVPLTQHARTTHRDTSAQRMDGPGVEVVETRPDAMPIMVSRSATRAAPGGERISIRLDPIELGSVNFDIRTSIDGQRDIRITVEKADTLALLRQDRHQLELALGRAGITAEPGQIQMSLARQDAFRADAVARDTTGASSWMTGDPAGQQQGGNPGERHPPASPEAAPHIPIGTVWAGGVTDAVSTNWAGTRVGPALNIVA